MKKCIVIGGGASGIMAAIAAADRGYDVALYEKNEKLGKKIYITGKGRCNVTNDCDADGFFANVISNRKFLYSAYYSYDNNMLMALLEKYGCRLKTERGGRVFPVSDHSSDVIRALGKALDDKGVQVNLSSEVASVIVSDGVATGIRLKNGRQASADKIIIATGGLSYSSTGSSGDGHQWLKSLGHSVKECRPALVPLTCEEQWYKQLQGLALKNVSVRLYEQKEYDNLISGKKCKTIFDGFGEMLFTHFGISGPLILSASSYYALKNYGERCVLLIDLKPALSYEQLDKRLLREFENNSNKSFKNVLTQLVPSSMVPVICEITQIGAERVINSISREERERLLNCLKGLVIHVTGTRDFNEAIITQGGISVKEIDPSTMMSRLVENLYIVGELIDVDALTGGYNLQIAWSTGHLAGDSLE